MFLSCSVKASRSARFASSNAFGAAAALAQGFEIVSPAPVKRFEGAADIAVHGGRDDIGGSAEGAAQHVAGAQMAEADRVGAVAGVTVDRHLPFVDRGKVNTDARV